MSSDITYPYERTESVFSNSPQNNLSDPQLFQDLVPSRQITMASMQAGPAQTATWQARKVFPPEKYVRFVFSRLITCTELIGSSFRYVGAAVQVVLHGISRLPMVAYVYFSFLRCGSMISERSTSCANSVFLLYRRVTIIDYRGFVMYDTYVRPT
jgi:hypothetical protein